jgi:glycosyltransferase involved in cell wall biosynthesis/uncharacterized SAM-binding protein YcdF (DUF218 family)
MKPLTVLYVINGLGTGGAERSLAEMLPGLLARGVRPHIVCLYPRHQGVQEDVMRQGFPVRVLHGPAPSRIWALRRLIVGVDPDLIHSTIFEANLAAGLAALGLAVPMLISLVNTPYVSERLRDPRISLLRLRAARLADGWVCRRFGTHCHAITEAVKRSAVHALRLPADRITVIERGRDAARLGTPSGERRRGVRRRLGVGDDEEVVISVGRQEFQKGQRDLLEAMRVLLPTRPRLRFLLAGRSGHATADLERWRRLPELRERVQFLGHREDVPDLLAASDLFVFPSLWEGLGGAVIEAMALGLPIVASDIPALREVTEPGRNSDLVPPASPPDLARAIAALLDDPQRRGAYGARSRQIFEERFTLERSVERMASLYHRLTPTAVEEANARRRVPPPRTERGRAASVLLAATVVALGAAVLLREPILQAAGTFLAVEDPLMSADAIIAISGNGPERVATAVQLWRAGYAPWLLLSGGPGEFSGSARQLRRYATDLGVGTESIIIDDTALSTVGNARGSAAAMQARGLHSAILVTSPYHMRRSAVIFRRYFGPVGMSVRAYPAQDSFFQTAGWWRRPQDRQLVIREYAKLVGFLAGIR